MAARIQASVSEADVLALLANEERTELFVKLGFRLPLDKGSETQFPIGRLIAEIVQLRQPFVRMMHEIAVLLKKLEASIRGNVRFVVLPGLDAELNLDFGPQVRKAVATALNSKLLVNHREAITVRIAEMDKEIRSLCEKIVPTRISRRTEIGGQLDKLADMLDHADPIRSRSYRFIADRAPQMNNEAYEFNVADRDTLRQVGDQLSKLKDLITRLRSGSRHLLESIPDVQSLLQQSMQRVQAKLQKAEHVSESQPYATRKTSERDLPRASDCISRVREAILAASEYVDSIDDLFDFLNLEIWKQRWRVYELWVLAHIVLQLMDLGFELSDTGRIIDGIWRLKFTNDASSVLGLERDGQKIDLYYQFYQARGETGDMPDIAVRLHGDRFIIVVDPKHGETYSRRDLNDVCRRYASAFMPCLSCVVNYFDVRISEELDVSPRSLVLYGLHPETESAQRFDDAIIDAFDGFWQERDFGSVRAVVLIVLLDGSTSADQCREALLQKFDQMLSELRRPALPQSRAFVFGNAILREGPITELTNRKLVQSLPDSGTDLASAFHAVRKRILDMPLPRELWIFTDGEVGNLTAFEEEIQSISSRVSIVESTNDNASPLREYCGRICGQYVRL